MKVKKILVGFIALWVLAFLVVWGITLSKKGPAKKSSLITQAMSKFGLGEETLEETSDSDMLDGMMPQEPGMVEDPGMPQQAQQQQVEAIPVRCYRVSPTDFKDELPVMGTVKGSLEIDLKFEINGVIEVINFREGDVVYKKDLIASLNKNDMQLKVDYSNSKLESAKTQSLAAKKKLEIHRNLYDIGGIIKAKLEEVELEARAAELQAKTAEVELKSAKAELKKTGLYAPRDGVLGSVDAEMGEFVTPQNKVATLYDTMKVFVELGIVEKDINKIALGQDVTVTVDTHPGMTFNGTIDNVFPVIEGKSRTLTVRVGIENEEAMLLPGMFARAMIVIAEFDDALLVPSFGLEKTDEGYKVFIVDENNKSVSSRIVGVSYVTTDYTVIQSGLNDGELVVSEAPQELKDGIPVNIIDIQESNIEEE
ncbi:MAG: efflux RND transporter periplasmic adaptor subunit [Candidatus Omnitrophota bacterium]